MLTKKLIVFISILFTCSCTNPQQNNSLTTINPMNKYEWVKDWPQLPAGFILGNPTGIAVDTSGNIFVFHRAERAWPTFGNFPDTPIHSATILMLDRNTGKIINSWGDKMFIMPHELSVDKDNNVWVTDVGLQQVFKFTHEGKLLMVIGEAKTAGNDSLHFDKPTAIAFANDGSFYVSDGYGNSRVVKFSSEGKYLFAWGTKGNASGEFDIPHGITLDEKGNVYVADRENSRVQVFDSSGNFLRQWTDKSFGHICAITFDKQTNNFIVVDDAVSMLGTHHNGSDIILFDTAGNILNRFGRTGSYDGPKCWYHDVTIDDDGNIYVGDILGNTIQKFRRVVAK